MKKRLLTPELADQSIRLYHLLRATTFHPVFDEALMRTTPAIFDFTKQNSAMTGLVKSGGENFQQVIDQVLVENGVKWGIGQYLERRDGVLAGTYIGQEQRYYHLGVDIAFPKSTSVFAPLDGEIYKAGYAEEWGDYGYYLSTKHELEGITFYLFYGHLKADSFLGEGKIKAGQKIAEVGDFHENGQWFHHIHLQVCLLPWEKGTPDGYCSEEMLDQYRLLNPNPLLIIKDFLPSLLSAN